MSDSIDQIIDTNDQLLNQLDSLLTKAEQRRSNKPEAATVNDVVGTTEKPRSKNQAANIAAIQLLTDAYPAVFDRSNVRPLKIGIQEDLVADEKVTKNKIKRALASYVRSLQYLRAVREGADRIDLNGQAAGTVTASESEHAKQQIKAINQRRRDAQREREKAQAEQEKQQRMNDKLEMLLSKKG